MAAQPCRFPLLLFFLLAMYVGVLDELFGMMCDYLRACCKASIPERIEETFPRKDARDKLIWWVLINLTNAKNLIKLS